LFDYRKSGDQNFIPLFGRWKNAARNIDPLPHELIPKLRSRHIIFAAALGTEFSELRLREFFTEQNISHDIRIGKRVPLLSAAGIDDFNAGKLSDGKGIVIENPLRQLADPLFSPTSPLHCPYAWKEAKQFCRQVGYALLEGKAREKGWSEKWHQLSSLGYGGIQGRLVLHTNVPKPTLTLLWCEGMYRNRPWVPLFGPRK
jgi:hypothetical protein